MDEADVADIVGRSIRRAWYLGIALGLIVGFWTTVLGMGLALAVWHWWLA